MKVGSPKPFIKFYLAGFDPKWRVEYSDWKIGQNDNAKRRISENKIFGRKSARVQTREPGSEDYNSEMNAMIFKEWICKPICKFIGIYCYG
jgi:hypothetical protein